MRNGSIEADGKVQATPTNSAQTIEACRGHRSGELGGVWAEYRKRADMMVRYEDMPADFAKPFKPFTDWIDSWSQELRKELMPQHR